MGVTRSNVIKHLTLKNIEDPKSRDLVPQARLLQNMCCHVFVPRGDKVEKITN